jgi:hypothetical protein
MKSPPAMIIMLVVHHVYGAGKEWDKSNKLSR